ncbi:calcium-binding protein PBP1 [Senna tora]|uniref:Calcium-binding protein PBP1 n=1 Tax=Senna tora TaxID=362788 RepID=A0A835CCM3_9FABA|nr:calcium-binding protein PBP1 [Senna tora]
MAVEEVYDLELEEYLPWMAASLGAEGLLRELCRGFMVLMDVRSRWRA